MRLEDILIHGIDSDPIIDTYAKEVITSVNLLIMLMVGALWDNICNGNLLKQLVL
jgi:hypothetical protein